ncbi:alpha/beta fold hydrolase [Mesorhizobium wenxiniae]|uniref:alpha/beta fold hydrolase n=1 Tax=Mesorhizobium wenxiniae TaxID=2014805 RepID=UPI001FDA8061|nr:alpha/beta fold hydrolase [Mesorhizobium wenxiniae]
MTTRRLAAILAADVVGFSSMMERDEEGTFARIKALQRTILAPQIANHQGRLVKTTGDGFLAEFASPIEALRAAIAIQGAINLSSDRPDCPSNPVAIRIGINLGDVIVEDDGDIYGEGVNVAARLEALAPAGGILISGKVHDEVEGKLNCGFEDRGSKSVKNIARPVRTYLVQREEPAAARSIRGAALQQEIEYCRAPDGVRLAWAKVGTGPPIVKAANWLNHLEYDWESPVWRAFLERLARGNTLIRYDARGNGLSDWDVPDVSLDAWVSDLKAVVDDAGLDRFALLGVSQGCAVSIAFAERYPERVSHLILYGGFALGARKRSPESRAKRDAMATLMRFGWGADEPVFRQMFTSQFMPDATKEQADVWNELQRRTTSPECAVRYFETVGDLDVRDLLPRVQARTLVMHVRGDLIAPLESGREVAAGIPDARFVAMEGRSHLVQEGEPAFERIFEEIRLFLSR